MPLSRASGATPTKAAICLRLSWPSSGSCAEQGAADDRADAGHAAEQILGGAPHRTGLNRLFQIAIDVRSAAAPASGCAARCRAGSRRPREAQAIPLGREHLEDLPPPGQDRLQGLGRLTGQGPRLGAHALGKEREQRRVDAIGLGELATARPKSRTWRGLATTTGRPRPPAPRRRRARSRPWLPARCSVGVPRDEAGQQRGDGTRLVGELPGLPGGADGDVERGLRDIDADEAGQRQTSERSCEGLLARGPALPDPDSDVPGNCSGSLDEQGRVTPWLTHGLADRRLIELSPPIVWLQNAALS